MRGKVKAFLLLDGDFASAIPNHSRMEPDGAGWSRMRLTVDVLTKLNRTRLLPGKSGYSLPDIFWHYDRRMWEPGGFQRDLPLKRREWRTDTGRANFVTPQALDGDLDRPDVGRDVLMPMWPYAVGSKTPAAKSIPVTVHSDDDAIIEPDMEDRSNDQA